ncbi:MAG: hypothetical protein MUP21_03295, partial [Dehalococcoidia bacterium]|nr:hypothetical protein [Dehalococcoidia bacterium]
LASITTRAIEEGDYFIVDGQKSWTSLGYRADWGFFLVIYTMVGLNRDVFLQEPGTLLLVSVVAFTGTFVLAEVINRISRRLGVQKMDRISFMLLGTRKNDGLAGAIALIFFDPRAAMPAALVLSFSVFHFVWLTWWVKRMR